MDLERDYLKWSKQESSGVHDVGSGLHVLQYRFGLDEFVFNCVQRHGVPPSGRGCVVGGAWHPLLSQGMPENCGIFAVVSRRGR